MKRRICPQAVLLPTSHTAIPKRLPPLDTDEVLCQRLPTSVCYQKPSPHRFQMSPLTAKQETTLAICHGTQTRQGARNAENSQGLSLSGRHSVSGPLPSTIGPKRLSLHQLNRKTLNPPQEKPYRLGFQVLPPDIYYRLSRVATSRACSGTISIYQHSVDTGQQLAVTRLATPYRKSLYHA
ncbi:hypothetical protein B0T25DRAFT_97599 [Lasiosphaeria hispida]|uniref:Uncharacterized protein n=1 Tax=Lasiosphaeria hispida TaxID=260671 RepID=A0AAJ0MHL9_9PEZI|nr:hypothetical protein B0T25DRAFT_97599 [Lasiosphaeria hispida]